MKSKQGRSKHSQQPQSGQSLQSQQSVHVKKSNQTRKLSVFAIFNSEGNQGSLASSKYGLGTDGLRTFNNEESKKRIRMRTPSMMKEIGI